MDFIGSSSGRLRPLYFLKGAAGQPPCAIKRAAEATLRSADLQSAGKQPTPARYELRAWMVMPNHVHVLFRVDAVPMSNLVRSWKRHTARQANRLLGRTGVPFWQEDYWDTWMRNEEHERTARRYIENNPAKARRVRDPREWPWSSARYRDEYNRLRLEVD